MTDDARWFEIVALHGEAILRVAYRVLGNLHDAEDVAQQVLLEVFERNKPLDLGMVKRIATFRAIDKLRGRRNELSLEEAAQLAVTDPATACLEEMEQAERLRTLLARLPRQQARCFWWRYVEGMTYREIAHQESMSVTAVATALNKARTTLRDYLHRELT